MEFLSGLQQVELFHLLFTRHLGERIDKSFFVLKGGCNLRFYFKSIRYSEDIDFDVRTVAPATLKAQVNKLLESAAFIQVLRSRGLEILDSSAPKQTETTQRWKIKLQDSATSLPVPTKVEFSRRGITEPSLFEAVDPDLIGTYRLYPIVANHYSRVSAHRQKIGALIHRSETQARDIFDLDVLATPEVLEAGLPRALQNSLDQAMENALSISFSDYRSQVVSYLAPEYQDHFGSEGVWNKMQVKLLHSLEKLKQANPCD